ncbi:hypothetical protein BG261_06485 [Floricoccus tropicus]|uniref:HTH cro/C1-type domain-containing protein n=1 Tax=Floricoccus tropicus TaxID=1859473 RepID=A0A1E8GJW7_9LACT|nr:helix-turn-helix transcriptional regulator [Floricoccus tropicus]OFI48539.1 hypothetical protein BG261_06485 [Floricoccus tropicus]
MELSKKIKAYRTELNISQEELAERLYVSRQTVSNWETERSYPDVNNLILLSTIFDVTLDQLVKGDIKVMKEKIAQKKYLKYLWIIIFDMLMCGILLGIYAALPKSRTIWFIFVYATPIISMVYSCIKIIKIQKSEDIKTYEEITAFFEGGDIDSARKSRISDYQIKLIPGTIFFCILVTVLMLLLMFFVIMFIRGIKITY